MMSKGNEVTSIPAQCCAMPYILNGKVHYNCSVNTAVTNDWGCYHGNGQSQWVTCEQPAGAFLIVIRFVTIYISGSRGAGPH